MTPLILALLLTTAPTCAEQYERCMGSERGTSGRGVDYCVQSYNRECAWREQICLAKRRGDTAEAERLDKQWRAFQCNVPYAPN